MNRGEGRDAGKTASGPRPRLYTIAPTSPFLDTLARAVLKGDLPVAGGTPPDKLGLTRWTILLPTRRAVRALGEAFLKVSGDPALLLPRIRPLGDVDEDALVLSPPPEAGNNAELALDLPAAISANERRLVLTKLILKWSRTLAAAGSGEAGYTQSATPAQASSLAVQLAALMDALDAEQVDLDAIESLAPERFADHWRHTLKFLEIVTGHWPAYLREQDVMAPYARRNALMAAETERLAASPPKAPVIAAGSTATAPATAALLEAVARLPDGAVVLPGLDMALDEESWQAINAPVPHPEHPQFGMHRFLSRLGASRDEVMALGADEARGARASVVSQALRPAGTTDKWLDFAGDADREAIAGALEGVARIDAPGEQDEAEVISLLLRQAAEQPGRTAALVTPDRTLARRVSIRLEKWRVDVDDSAGTPLDKTLPGSFMDAVVDAAGTGFAPVPLLALLKHPFTLLGRDAGAMRRAARALELVAMRQPATAPGFAALRTTMARTRRGVSEGTQRQQAVLRLEEKDWRGVEKLLDDLETVLRPLTEIFEKPDRTTPLNELLRAHVQAGEALAANAEGSGAALWRGEAGEALAGLFESLLTAESSDLEIAPADYPELYRSFVAGLAVRPRGPRHPRIFIWGPLEARLQRPDMVVLGGLNEGVWPASVETDPWLSRPMRAEIGLSAPERRIGLAAHDVAQLLGVEKVYLTRAEKAGGAPSVPSRWLLRLDAVLDAVELKGALEPAEPWLEWARARDRVEAVAPVRAPAPRPPVSARPRRLSVTRIEAWIASPYAIFAGDILRLKKLDGIAEEPGPALKGMLVHDLLQRFAQAYPDKLPSDIEAALMHHANALFGEFGGQARIEAFWRGQFANFARWFAATEPARREGVSAVNAEVKGALEIDGNFTLSARADRIDIRADGTLAIYDYKTGSVPSEKQIEETKAPQLPLEGVIAQAGGFEGLPAAPVSRLVYIRARGYGEGGEERDAGKKIAPDELAVQALEHLETLVGAYAIETQPYEALRRAGFRNSAQYRYDDYAHLARVQEWQAGGEGEE
ncbi:PD-(D/E)XK nuclease superfamily protein [bacterium BMS3Bbin10]|nr:PD-(D/E)XK nuclease superfamily protein [bacterium BMS3Bbin10]